MKRAVTLAAVRLLKDGHGNYLCQPSYQAGQHETILGRPVLEMKDMPDIAATATLIMFGDFKAGYRIYDRVELAVKEDPYTQAGNGMVRFYARKCVGASAVRTDVFRKLKMAAQAMPSALQPAAEIPLQIGPHTVTLRASLRVAVALEALPGGIASLWDDIARQKITAIQAVIRHAATDRQGAEIALAYAATIPLVQIAPLAQAACLALFAAILAPAQGEATPSQTPPSDPMPLSRFFTELFSRATSWLHWPPSEVWNASVAEIVTALEAQAERELRRAGIRPEDKEAKAAQRQGNLDAGLDPDFDRAGLLALKAKM